MISPYEESENVVHRISRNMEGMTTISIYYVPLGTFLLERTNRPIGIVTSPRTDLLIFFFFFNRHYNPSWVSACSTVVEHSQQEGFTECRCQRHV
jgi:hypothetical protein